MDTYGYVSSKYTRTQKTQVMGFQVPQALETQESGSFLWQLQAWWANKSMQTLDKVDEGRE